ncbi:hypothetical protein GFV14_00523 [Candidatus Hartigia pinicola]|nr:hypothetical protein GFV14_00523 [Candidatus Hartigia pinicola]
MMYFKIFTNPFDIFSLLYFFRYHSNHLRYSIINIHSEFELVSIQQVFQ